MGSYKSIYGVVTFKNDLSESQVKRLEEITDRRFYVVGDTEIEFNDDWFDIDDFIDWAKRLRKNKVVSGYICDYGGDGLKFEYDPKTKQWNEYPREFLCDMTDDTLIGELKSRGYIITKGDEHEEVN